MLIIIFIYLISQLIAMTREVIGDIRDVIEDCNRMKFISQGAVTVVATVYGSVSSCAVSMETS